MKLTYTLAATLFPFTLLGAGTIRVPQDQPSIAAAVNAAAAGDTIQIAAGVYREAVVVDAALNGLVLQGKGKVIIEPRDPQLGALGPGIEINADDVKVRNVTIRHAKGGSNAGVHIVNANSVVLEKVTVLHAEGVGILGAGKLLRVENCVVQGCAGGIALTSDGATVRKTTLEQDGADGIRIVGDSAVVEKCKVRLIEDGSGITVVGSLGRVEGNDIALIDTFGVWIDGAVNTVRGNKIRSMPDDGYGVLVQHGQSGTLIEKNSVTDVTGSAFVIDVGSSSIVLRKNVAKNCGAEDEACYVIDGFFTTLENNVAQRTQSDGFRVTSNFNELTGNVAKSCLEDGFDLDGGANQLMKNVAIGNAGEGIESSSAQNSCVGNKASKNRIDVAASAAFANFENNVFKTGGENTMPEIDD
jgi:hypothetical protein